MEEQDAVLPGAAGHLSRPLSHQGCPSSHSDGHLGVQLGAFQSLAHVLTCACWVCEAYTQDAGLQMLPQLPGQLCVLEQVAFLYVQWVREDCTQLFQSQAQAPFLAPQLGRGLLHSLLGHPHILWMAASPPTRLQLLSSRVWPKAL